jgi:hypothetical protein
MIVEDIAKVLTVDIKIGDKTFVVGASIGIKNSDPVGV